MVYIYRKKKNGKDYYYLRISKRLKGRVFTKDIAYLGNNITKVASKLDNLQSKYASEIRKSYEKIKHFIDSNTYLEKVKKLKIKNDDYLKRELLEDIEAINLHFKTNFLKLNEETIMNTYKNFLVEFAYNTTSIEGNTITLKEANKLLRENLTPKEKSLREVYDLQNTQEIFFNLLENRPKFNHELIMGIHKGLMKNIDKRIGYRNHDIRVFKSHFESSPAKYVKTDMNLLLKWFNENEKKLHPLVLGVLFHQKFEKIHPFSDGNGRTGRMILNYMLIMKNYPPFIIKRKNRSEYLKNLSKADKSDLNGIKVNHYSSLVNYVGDEFVESYWNNFNI